MTVDYTNPQSMMPPPPSPPPSGPAKFDFVKSFTFFFEDPAWITKILIGGLCYIGVFILIGAFVLLGYVAQLGRNVIAGVANPLPEWDRIGDYIMEGLKLFVVAIVYALPLMLLWAAMFGIAFAASQSERGNEVASMAMSCGMLLYFPLLLIMMFWVPIAMLFAIATQRLGAAFEFGTIFRFIKANFVNYVLAILTHIVAGFAAEFGLILLCIGVVFTMFWSMCVGIYALAQAYRAAAPGTVPAA